MTNSPTGNRRTCRSGPKDDPRSYWEAADEHERVNGRLFRNVEFALPRELNEGDQVELARGVRVQVDQRGAANGCPIRWPCIAARGRTPTPT